MTGGQPRDVSRALPEAYADSGKDRYGGRNEPPTAFFLTLAHGAASNVLSG